MTDNTHSHMCGLQFGSYNTINPRLWLRLNLNTLAPTPLLLSTLTTSALSIVSFMQAYYVALVSVVLYILKRLVSARSIGSRPPGPSAWPVIGNLLDMPKEREWETFQKWARRWGGSICYSTFVQNLNLSSGDIVSVSVAGRTIIILNSAQEAVEMLEGRGSIYSDRPTIPIADLVGWSHSPSLAQSKSEMWKQGRKFFHQLLGTNASVARFIPVEEQETQRFLIRLSSCMLRLRFGTWIHHVKCNMYTMHFGVQYISMNLLLFFY